MKRSMSWGRVGFEAFRRAGIDRTEDRPAISGPLKRTNGEFRHAALTAIVKVGTEPKPFTLFENPRVTRPDECAVRAKQQCAATAREVFAFFVEVRTRDAAAAADANV